MKKPARSSEMVFWVIGWLSKTIYWLNFNLNKHKLLKTNHSEIVYAFSISNLKPSFICRNYFNKLEFFSVKFEEKPDITYLRRLFKDLFYRSEYEWDFIFDWVMVMNQI
jgi:hypothetical protein